MLSLRNISAGLRSLLRKKKADGELDEELREFMEMAVQEKMNRGMNRADAVRAVRMERGSVELNKEVIHSARWESVLETYWRDASYGLRMLRKNLGFTTIAVLTLALGIGANTAIFSVVDAVLLRPLPFHDPNRLVSVQSTDLTDPSQGGDISYPAFLDWRSQTHSFEAMSVYNVTGLTYTGGAQAESVRTAVVSANLFSTLGVSPSLGRAFAEKEDRPSDGQFSVVLSYEFWQSHFAGDPKILGRAITLDNQLYTIIGVMPDRFQFPIQKDRVELWISIAHDLQGSSGMATQRGASYLQVIGRLRAGIQIPQAQSEVLSVQQRMNRQYPENRPRGVAIQSESNKISGAMRPALLILLGAVTFVLLIACANVASLLLARGTVRQKELTLRLALGASRATVTRQLLVESVLLALLGGTVGLFVARWGTSTLVAMSPEGLARTSEIQLDLRVLAFTFFVALATGVLFGLAPALRARRLNLSAGLSASGRGSGTVSDATRLRSTLVISQLAIAFVLLIGAGLLVRSFNRLLHVDPGFRPDHVLTFLLDVPSERHPRAQRAAFVEDLLQSLRALPSVKSAGAIFGLPLNEDQSAFTVLEVEGQPVPASQRPRVGFRIIDSQYFHTMGIRLLQGRAFTPGDEQGGLPIAIVNQTLAREIFHNQNPLGRRIKPNISFGADENPPVRQIVGVVADVRSNGIAESAAPEVYAPQTPNDFFGETTVVVRTATAPNSLVSAIRSLVSSKDKELPLRDVRTLDEYVNGSISVQRFQAFLLTAFALLAFVLTAVGLYGVLAYSVTQRSREIGIRMALGAERRNIHIMVLRQGALLVLTGIAAGLIASLFAVQLMRALLYGIQPIDPATFVAVPVLLLVVAFLASYLPARRASRVDPMVALRHE